MVLGRERKMTKNTGLVGSLAFALAMLVLPLAADAELQPEPIPNVEKLPLPYPGSFAVVHDFAFSGLI